MCSQISKINKKAANVETPTVSFPLTFLCCWYQQLADTYKVALSGYLNSLSSKGEEKAISSGRS